MAEKTTIQTLQASFPPRTLGAMPRLIEKMEVNKVSSQVTLEQLELQIAQLSLDEQLKLIAYIAEQLSTIPLDMSRVGVEEDVLRRQRQRQPEGGIEMGVAAKAIETTGRIDAQSRLVLDEELPVVGPTRVRVIILLPEEVDIDEMEWLRAATANPAFDFLKEPEEDIYTLADGRPFHDQG